MNHCRSTATLLAVSNPLTGLNPLARLNTFAGLLKAFAVLRSRAWLSLRAGLNPLAAWSPRVVILVSLVGATGGLSASARGAEIPFTEHVISTTAGNAQSVFATDLDGDGDIDVLSAGFDGEIAWYENDGGSPPIFTERVISTSADSARSVFAIDVDGDGDIDVLSASCKDDKIAWYDNDGGSPPTFTERVITEDPDGFAVGVQGFADCPYSVFATDVDGDGNIDVLSASRNDDKIAWYENDGGLPPSFTARVITEDPDGPGGVEGFADDPWSVFAADLDGDGDIDVLSASEGWPPQNRESKVAWYESDGGSPPTFTERVISTTARWAVSVFAKDMDGDGDIDVLSGAYPWGALNWYENDGGSPPTFTLRSISGTDGTRSIFATDMDGDGDIDVLAPSYGDDKITWYENDSSSPPTFTQRVITEDPDGSGGVEGFADGASSAFAIDLDGDGDIDVLSASWNDDKIAWYENTTPTCGNGVVAGTEQCDDGNTADGDGCSATCTVEEGWNCSGDPSTCTEVCGDGLIVGSEACDDGVANSDTAPDACRTDCTLPECGDGVVDMGEACDDGNTNNADACFSTCEINPNPIPATSQWGLIITLLLVLAGGTILIGHTRRATDQTACT